MIAADVLAASRATDGRAFRLDDLPYEVPLVLLVARAQGSATTTTLR